MPFKLNPGCTCCSGCQCGLTTIDVEFNEPSTNGCGDCTKYAGTFTLTKLNPGDTPPPVFAFGAPTNRPSTGGLFDPDPGGEPYSKYSCRYAYSDLTLDHCDAEPFSGTGVQMMLVIDPGDDALGYPPDIDLYIDWTSTNTGNPLQVLFRVDSYFTDDDCTNTATAVLYDWPYSAYDSVRVFHDYAGNCPGLVSCCTWPLADTVTINP